MESQDPTVEFDHHSAVFNADPVGAWDALRDRCPVARTDAHGGYWVITGADEGAAARKQPSIFSSARSPYGPGGLDGIETMIPKNPSPTVVLPIESDPPEQTAYRQLLSTIMSPDAAEKLRPPIRTWVTHFIDDFIEAGECDLVYGLASPVPAVVTLEWLGWPTEEFDLISHTYHNLMGSAPGSEEFLTALRGRDQLAMRMRELVVQRRDDPRDDVMSFIVGSEIDGVPVSDDRAVSLISVLLIGGVDTTTALTAQTLMHLHQHPEHRRALIDNPELWPSATEEFLRMYPPVATNARTVRADVELGGCHLAVGDRVLISNQAANRDPRAFEAPDQVVLDRFPNRHHSFGLGPHRCAGSHVARVIFQEMVVQVLERLPDYSIDEASATRYPDQGAFNGWTLLPTTFTPGARRG